MSISWGDLLGAVFVAPVSCLGWNMLFRSLGWTYSFRLGWVITAAAGVVVGCWPWSPDWNWAAGSGISLIAGLAFWWWRRKKRRKAAALVGAKSRALRDAIVRKAREVARPRPVLRPVPVPR